MTTEQEPEPERMDMPNSQVVGVEYEPPGEESEESEETPEPTPEPAPEPAPEPEPVPETTPQA